MSESSEKDSRRTASMLLKHINLASESCKPLSRKDSWSGYLLYFHLLDYSYGFVINEAELYFLDEVNRVNIGVVWHLQSEHDLTYPKWNFTLLALWLLIITNWGSINKPVFYTESFTLNINRHRQDTRTETLQPGFVFARSHQHPFWVAVRAQDPATSEW